MESKSKVKQLRCMENSFDFEQLLADTKTKVKRLVLSGGLMISPGGLESLLNIVDSSIRTLKFEMDLLVPKKSKSLNTINCIGDKVIGYHYVDGVRRQIVQITQGDEIIYYTDGIRERV
jgi:hypothetical protein